MRKNLRTKYRILRDKGEKERKRNIKYKNELNYNSVVTLQHAFSLINSVKKNVSWKRSVQDYDVLCLFKVFSDYEKLHDRILPKPVSDKTIILYERGKPREITPIHVKDRMIQKIFCDYSLVPVISNSLIYDNGASLKGKGVLFSRLRMEKHLRAAYKEWGSDFYVMCYDFKDFFNSIPHKTCKDILDKYYNDKDLVTILMEIIKCSYKNKIYKIKDVNERKRQLKMLDDNKLSGICLGSQVSQSMALVVPNELDHLIKDNLKIKHYVRYMDDGVLMAKRKEDLHHIFIQMKLVCDSLGLKFNENKTCIVKVSKGFKFLKVNYKLTETGRIIKRLSRKTIVRMRRKLHKMHRKYLNGTMKLDDVFNSLQSWISHASYANSFHTMNNMVKLYIDLYGDYKTDKFYKKYKKQRRTINVLQTDKWEQYRWHS